MLTALRKIVSLPMLGLVNSRARVASRMVQHAAFIVLVIVCLAVSKNSDAAVTVYQVRGNAVANSNNISAIGATETTVYTNYPGGNAATIAQCPDGFLYYVINAGGTDPIYKFNPQTPEVAPVQLSAGWGNPPGDSFRLACNNTGTLYSIPDSGIVYTVSTTTGNATSTGNTITGLGSGGDMAFNAAGTLYVINSSRALTTAAIGGGAATNVGTVTFPGGNTPATLGLAFDNAGTLLTVAQQGGGLANSGVFSINLGSLAATLVTNVAGSTTTGDLSGTDVPPPNVTVTKTDGAGQDTYAPGGTTTYTVTITNNSAYPVTYTVTDNQPANTTFGNWTCTPAAAPAGSTCLTANGTGNTITGTRVRLAAGGAATYSIPVTYAAGATGAITNTASVAAPAFVPAVTGTTTASDTNQPRPTLNKSFSGALVEGQTTTLTFTITGTVVVATSFTDTLPAGLRIAPTPAVGGTCTGGTVTANAGANNITVAGRNSINGSCTITVAITTAAAPTTGTCPQANNTNANANISATQNITPAIADSAAGGGTAAAGSGACVSVAPSVNVNITKSDAKTAATSGSSNVYSIVVANGGPSPANNAVLKDPAVAGLNCTAITCAVTTGTATCPAAAQLTIANLQGAGGITIPTLPANSSLTFTLTCTVTANGT